jgi:PKD repeat protein
LVLSVVAAFFAAEAASDNLRSAAPTSGAPAFAAERHGPPGLSGLAELNLALGGGSLPSLAPLQQRLSLPQRQGRHPVSAVSPETAQIASNWSIVATPNVTTPAANLLTSISCLSPTDCWSVGSYQLFGAAQTLTEHWDGTDWSVFSSPNINPAYGEGEYFNTLQAVNCISTSNCWAVGEAYYTVLADGSTHGLTLVEHWDGTAWTLVTSPNTDSSATDIDYLYGVSCDSATDCWAVGAYTNNPVGGTYQTLIEHYDGSSWTLATSPSNSSTQTFLSAVDCLSSSNCVAVGYQVAADSISIIGPSTSTLIEQWNGSSWSIVNSPNSGLTNVLLGVSCASSSDCEAVGQTGTEVYGAQTLVEHWNGTLWALELTSTDLSSQDDLASVSCVTASDCWAVGTSISEANPSSEQTLIEYYNGTVWAVVTSPDDGEALNVFQGIACTSPSQCLTVGDAGQPGRTDALIAQWNGSAWNSLASPLLTPPEDNFLNGIVCLSDTTCWAAGAYDDAGNLAVQTLLEQWNGSAWNIVASPNEGTEQGNILSGIGCASANECWAVGVYYEPSSLITQTLIEEWSGASGAWSVVSAPDTSASLTNALNSVACASESNCWAVGYAETAAGFAQTLIEQWNGTAWAIVSSPNASAADSNVLYGVTCTSASQCWAVGYSGATAQTLIELWDGTSWAIVASPDTGPALTNVLDSVSCISANNCWAVGYGDTSSTFSQALIAQWDGTSWNMVSAPSSAPAQQNYLDAVTCVSASDCRAVGGISDEDGDLLTLIEQWDGTAWSIVPSSNASGSGTNNLNGIACASSSDCWTAGNSVDPSNSFYQALIERDTTNPLSGSSSSSSSSSSGGSSGSSSSSGGGSSSGGDSLAVTLQISPSSGIAPLATSLVASTTAPGGDSINSYTFNFGDGTAITQSGSTASHTYSAGSYTASVTVADSLGNRASASAVISAQSAPALGPQASLSVSTNSGVIPLTVNFSAAGSTDAKGTITSYSFDFGDGSASVSGSSANVSHLYTAAGNFQASVTVTSSDGRTAAAYVPIQATASITISPASGPVAELQISPSSGAAPLTVALNGSNSFDTTPGASITRYTFDFGDGTAPVSQSSPGIDHIYTAAGIYKPSLTVSDSNQATSSAAIATARVGLIGGTAATSSGGAFGPTALLPLLLGAVMRRRGGRRQRTTSLNQSSGCA